MSTPSPTRVAALHLREAGIFQGPPLLGATIRTWMQSVYAGHVLAVTETRLAEARDEMGPVKEAYATIKAVEKKFEKDIQDLVGGEQVRWSVPKVTGARVYPQVLAVKNTNAPPDATVRWTTSAPYQVGVGDRNVSYRLSIPTNLEDAVYQSHRIIRQARMDALETILRYKDFPPAAFPEKTLVELALLRRECLKYTTKAKSYTTKAERDFKVDLEGWRYLDRWLDEANRRRSLTNKEVLDAITAAEDLHASQVKHYPVAVALKDATTPEEALEIVKSFGADPDDLLPNAWRMYLKIPTTEPTLRFPGDDSGNGYIPVRKAKERLLPMLTRENLGKHLESASHGEVHAVLWFITHTERGGQWSDFSRTLEVDVVNPKPLSVRKFQEGLDRIAEVTRHEVQHVGQSFLSFGKADGKDKWEGGMPSFHIQHPGVDTSGLPMKWRGLQDLKKVKHELRPTEFHTDLADAIDRFTHLIRMVPKSEWQEATRSFVGLRSNSRLPTNEHFKVWKKHSPDLWRKAVSEFVKAVGERGITPPSTR